MNCCQTSIKVFRLLFPCFHLFLYLQVKPLYGVSKKDNWMISSIDISNYHQILDDVVDMEYHFTRSKFGNRCLVIGGHRYKFGKKKGSEERWLCIKTTRRCNAFAVTIDDVLVRMTERHNHD